MKKKYFLLIIFGFTFSLSTFAQEAENLFKTYKKWGFTAQFNVFNESTSTPTPTALAYYKLNSTYNPAIGVSYNFLQLKNWNFKAEMQLQWVGSREEMFVSESETALSTWWRDEYIWNAENLVYIPITIEYYKKVTSKINIYGGVGLGVSYLKYNSLGSGSFRVGDVEVFTQGETDNFEKDFFTSGHIEVGATIKLNKALLQSYFTYKKSYQDFYKGFYEFKNLNTLPDQVYEVNQSGSYIGVGMRLYLKKGAKLFKRKNK